MTTTGQQWGAGMVEVLVAIVVFAVGILGTFSLQIAAKKANFEAAQHSLATELARDIIERMRGNRGELDAYVAEDIGSAPPAAGTDCRLVACTSGQLAEHDLSQWTLRLTGADELVSIDGSEFDAGGLLMPRACISSNSREVSVAIAWRGTGKIIDGSDSDCGKSSALYGPENEQRRVLVLTTYIGRT